MRDNLVWLAVVGTIAGVIALAGLGNDQCKSAAGEAMKDPATIKADAERLDWEMQQVQAKLASQGLKP